MAPSEAFHDSLGGLLVSFGLFFVFHTWVDSGDVNRPMWKFLFFFWLPLAGAGAVARARSAHRGTRGIFLGKSIRANEMKDEAADLLGKAWDENGLGGWFPVRCCRAIALVDAIAAN